ncbi:LytR/AlgR family response regulator transcription factor [Pleionea sediminis]|uniref:LytR/AlgR family response regulator transcription factor n=1 Tax=Pleionea sediminis TaxID=2569479 RepID=UPI0011866394|nr:LytTR family DNA-binding domain-containing protein [Pleionea sediminis]
MNLLITDDEPLARQRLERMLAESNPNSKVFEASTGREALDICNKTSIDLVFLDIRMPEMDGLEAAGHLMQLENPPAVIFVTAYDDYALDAFSVNAIDYLLKPINRENLAKAIAKASRLNSIQIQKAVEQTPDASNRKHISARIRGEVRLVPVNDIFYFQADQKYINVKHKGGETLIEDPLKQLEKEFSDQFVRIHRNALVNKQYIHGLTKNEKGHLFIVLKDCEDELEVSRRHAAEIRKLVKQL